MFCSCLPDLGALSLHARATEMDAGPSEPRGRLTFTVRRPEKDPSQWGRLKAELLRKIRALEHKRYKLQFMRELWERRDEWPELVSKERETDPDPVRGKKKKADPLTQYADLDLNWYALRPKDYREVLTMVQKYTQREQQWVIAQRDRGLGPSSAQLLREVEDRRYEAQRDRDDAQQALDQAQYRPPADDGPAFDWQQAFGSGAAKPEMSDSEDDG